MTECIRKQIRFSRVKSRELVADFNGGRLENRVGRKALANMSKFFVDHFLASHETPPAEIVLDFEAADDPVHGQR